MISKYLGDRPFWKVLLRLALPVAIQNVLTSSFQLVDTLMECDHKSKPRVFIFSFAEGLRARRKKKPRSVGGTFNLLIL